jgi:flagellum-specific ATP synthase
MTEPLAVHSQRHSLSQQLLKMLDHPARLLQKAGSLDPWVVHGTIETVRGNLLIASGFPAPIGSVCRVDLGHDRWLEAEVVGFQQDQTLLSPCETPLGIQPGQSVHPWRFQPTVDFCPSLLGRIIDPAGRPLDGFPAPSYTTPIAIESTPVAPMLRPVIDQPLATGIRAIDTLQTIGRGQRVGILAGAGVGKTTLLGMLARGVRADVVVIGLIGERGREVKEFLQQDLGINSQQRVVSVVATSDQSACQRVRAAKSATAIAEQYRDQGKHVLLLIDSLTRLAMAQREIGLAAGEIPMARGYPPSVLSMLPTLLERAGTSPRGTITAFYTVLIEGDDPNEPLADHLRSLLDGVLLLDRSLAARGHFPAIDPLKSLSRLMDSVVSSEQLAMAQRLRATIALYKDHEDLIQMGAYTPGTHPALDLAVTMAPQWNRFLQQGRHESFSMQESWQQLQQLIGPLEQHDASIHNSSETPPGSAAQQDLRWSRRLPPAVWSEPPDREAVP